MRILVYRCDRNYAPERDLPRDAVQFDLPITRPDELPLIAPLPAASASPLTPIAGAASAAGASR